MSETTTKATGPYLEGTFLRKYGEPGFYRVEVEVDSPIADAYPEPGTRVDLYPWTNDDRDEQIATLTSERDALKAKLTRGPARIQEAEAETYRLREAAEELCSDLSARMFDSPALRRLRTLLGLDPTD